MKKRLIAFVLVLVMLLTSAFAVVPYGSVEYTRPNLQQLKNSAEQMRKTLTQENAFSKIEKIYSVMQNEYEKIYTMYALAVLKSNQDVTSIYANEVSECYKTLVDAHELMRATTVMMFESQYEDTFREVLGNRTVDSILATNPMTEEERAIEGEIAEKIKEYNQLIVNPSAIIDGKCIKMENAASSEEEKKIYDLWAYELGEIYLELVALRKELSADTNPLAEAYLGYARDYSLKNASAFDQMVSEKLGGVYGKLSRVYDRGEADTIDLDMSMEDAIRLIASALTYVDGALMDSYRVMKENNLFDVEYSKTKANAGFTVIFPSYQMPFLYFQPNNYVDGLHTFLHEFGHFHQKLNSNLHQYWPGYGVDMDAIEVASQALPLIVGDKMSMLIGEEAGEALQKFNVEFTVYSLLSGCLVDEFEQFVYSTDNLTVDLLNEKFGELMKKYHVPWSGTTWTQISHIYETPGYYISYAVSAITSMEIWEKFENDPKVGRESYLAAVEACEMGYHALLAKAKLRNPFSAPELLERIATLIEDEFSLLVDTYGHWAEEEIDLLAGAGMIHGYTGADGKNYFKPNQSVTRAEFVKLLYVLSGDEAEATENFSDVADSDWFAPYVAWAAENGLVYGVTETEFRPNDSITRQDMAMILERYLASKNKTLSAEVDAEFTDSAQVAEYARFAVSRLRKAEILNGMPDGSFRPRESATRAEIATVLYTLTELPEESAEEPAVAKQSAPISLLPIPLMVR